jgi:heme exporter protein B
MRTTLRTALLVARKDLVIEWRSRVLANQVLPFVFVVVVLFAFGFQARIQLLSAISPGLFWVAAFFGLDLALQRAQAIEGESQARMALQVLGVDARGVFLGKVAAVVLQILALEVVLAVGVAILFSAPLHDIWILAPSALLVDIGVSAVGLVLAGISQPASSAASLLPLLLFPVVLPVLLGATKVWQYGLAGTPGRATPWFELVAGFALVYLLIGGAVYGVVLEE